MESILRILHRPAKAIFLVAVLVAALSMTYGPSGNIRGKVIDKSTAEAVPFANVVLMHDSTVITGCTSDIDGLYAFNNVGPGKYDIKVSFVGFKQLIIKNVAVNEGKITFLDLELEATAVSLDVLEVRDYRVPLISKDKTSTGATVSSEEIAKMPGRTGDRTTTTAGGVYSADGERGSVRGSRSESTVYYVDGVKVRGSSSLPASAVEEVTVITGGTPASRGESAEVVMETKSSSHGDSRKESPKPIGGVTAVPAIKAGTLTAGELHDFSKWKLWEDVAKDDLKQFQDVWDIKPFERFTLQCVNKAGRPVIDAVARLMGADGELLWTARTDNTGKAELWAALFGKMRVRPDELSLLVDYQGMSYHSNQVIPFEQGINLMEIPAACSVPQTVQAVFMVDATGSMAHELEYLKAEMGDIIARVKARHTEVSIDLGSVFYRDFGDDYVTKVSGLSPDIGKTADFIKQQHAAGGGDYEEAVDLALKAAIDEIRWSDDARTRLLFLVLDAPPHVKPEIISSLQATIRSAAAKGIRIIPITGAGINKSTEYLLRSWSLATNGTYVFLTDHSGVGGEHLKPSTDRYRVELLNNLIVRLFDQFLYVPPCELSQSATERQGDSLVYVLDTVIDHVIIDPERLRKYAQEQLPGDTNRISFIDPKERGTNGGNDSTLKSDIPHPTSDIRHPTSDIPHPTSDIIFRYYPNPTFGDLHLEFSKEVDEIFLTDVGGKLIERYKVIERESLLINIGRYPAGIYFLKCRGTGKWVTGKVILER